MSYQMATRRLPLGHRVLPCVFWTWPIYRDISHVQATKLVYWEWAHLGIQDVPMCIFVCLALSENDVMQNLKIFDSLDRPYSLSCYYAPVGKCDIDSMSMKAVVSMSKFDQVSRRNDVDSTSNIRRRFQFD